MLFPTTGTSGIGIVVEVILLLRVILLVSYVTEVAISLVVVELLIVLAKKSSWENLLRILKRLRLICLASILSSFFSSKN